MLTLGDMLIPLSCAEELPEVALPPVEFDVALPPLALTSTDALPPPDTLVTCWLAWLTTVAFTELCEPLKAVASVLGVARAALEPNTEMTKDIEIADVRLRM